MGGGVSLTSRRLLVAFAVIVSVLAGVGIRESFADPGDIGIPGPSFGSTLSFPTADCKHAVSQATLRALACSAPH